MNTSFEPDQTPRPAFWRRAIAGAVLFVLGITPWAHAQLPLPDEPALCPPLTSIATPTLFNLFSGTTPIRFPFL